jgi:hypothetical protein
MKLTSSQDRDAIGGWIEGQADRAEGKRILGELPRLPKGEGYLWAPSDGVLTRVAFPQIRTFDSSRTPRRGERIVTPRTLADVDLSAIVAALATTTTEKEAGARAQAAARRPASRNTRARRRSGSRSCDRTGKREPRAARSTRRNWEDRSISSGERRSDQNSRESRRRSWRRRLGTSSPEGTHKPPRRARGRRRPSSSRVQAARGAGATRASALHVGAGSDACRTQAVGRTLQRWTQGVARRGLHRRGE